METETAPDKIQSLYDAVSQDYDIGSFDEFKSKMVNPEKQKAFYDGIGKEYDLGTFDDFSSKLSTPKADKLPAPEDVYKVSATDSQGSLSTAGSSEKSLEVPPAPKATGNPQEDFNKDVERANTLNDHIVGSVTIANNELDGINKEFKQTSDSLTAVYKQKHDEVIKTTDNDAAIIKLKGELQKKVNDQEISADDANAQLNKERTNIIAGNPELKSIEDNLTKVAKEYSDKFNAKRSVFLDEQKKAADELHGLTDKISKTVAEVQKKEKTQNDLNKTIFNSLTNDPFFKMDSNYKTHEEGQKKYEQAQMKIDTFFATLKQRGVTDEQIETAINTHKQEWPLIMGNALNIRSPRQKQEQEAYHRAYEDNGIGLASSSAGTFDQAVMNFVAYIPKDVGIVSNRIVSGLKGYDIPAEMNQFYKVGSAISNWASEYLPTNPKFKEHWLTGFSETAGSLLPYMMGGEVTGSIKGALSKEILPALAKNEGEITVGKLFAEHAKEGLPMAAMASISSATQGYQKAIEVATDANTLSQSDFITKYAEAGNPESIKNVDAQYQDLHGRNPNDVAWGNFKLGLVQGAPFMFSPAMTLSRLDKVTGGYVQGVIGTGFNGGVDGLLQFSTMKALENISAQQTYEKTRHILDGVVDAGSDGFMVNGIISALSAALTRGRTNTSPGSLERAYYDKAIAEVKAKGEQASGKEFHQEANSPVVKQLQDQMAELQDQLSKAPTQIAKNSIQLEISDLNQRLISERDKAAAQNAATGVANIQKEYNQKQIAQIEEQLSKPGITQAYRERLQGQIELLSQTKTGEDLPFESIGNEPIRVGNENGQTGIVRKNSDGDIEFTPDGNGRIQVFDKGNEQIKNLSDVGLTPLIDDTMVVDNMLIGKLELDGKLKFNGQDYKIIYDKNAPEGFKKDAEGNVRIIYAADKAGNKIIISGDSPQGKEVLNSINQKGGQNAVQEPSASGVLPHSQETAEKAGSGRGGVGSRQSGNSFTQKGEEKKVESLYGGIEKPVSLSDGEQERYIRISGVGFDEKALSESEKPIISLLRGEGDKNLQRVAEFLRSISQRYGGSTDESTFSGEDKHQWRLLQRKLQVGDNTGAEFQQAEHGQGSASRKNDSGNPTGKTVGNSGDNISDKNKKNVGGGGANKKDSGQEDNLHGENATLPAMGEGTGVSGENATTTDSKRVGSTEGNDKTTKGKEARVKELQALKESEVISSDEETELADLTKPKEEKPAATTKQEAPAEPVYQGESVKGISGKEGETKFTADKETPFTYKLVESDELQPSHLPSGERNSKHRISRAQPKERNDAGSRQAQDKIAANPNFKEVSESPNAYFGAPITNQFGEVLQGNNRSIGLKQHYAKGGTQYKTDLAANAEKFGLTKEQVESMQNPVLVREVNVGNEEAITLGQHDVKDLETGGKQRIDPIATSRKLTPKDKSRLASLLFADDKTLKESIRDNVGPVSDILKNHINSAQFNALFNKEGGFTAKGMNVNWRVGSHINSELKEIYPDFNPADIKQAAAQPQDTNDYKVGEEVLYNGKPMSVYRYISNVTVLLTDAKGHTEEVNINSPNITRKVSEHTAITTAEKAHAFAKEKGFDAANHLLSFIKKSGLGDYKNVQDVPADVMKLAETAKATPNIHIVRPGAAEKIESPVDRKQNVIDASNKAWDKVGDLFGGPNLPEGTQTAGVSSDAIISAGKKITQRLIEGYFKAEEGAQLTKEKLAEIVDKVMASLRKVYGEDIKPEQETAIRETLSKGIATDDGFTTGTKNAITERELDELGLYPLEKQNVKHNEPTVARLKADIDAGKIDPMKVANDILQNKDDNKLTPDEKEWVLMLQKVALKKQFNDAQENIGNAQIKSDIDAVEKLAAKKQSAADDFYTVAEAAKEMGTRWGRQGQARSREMLEDYSLVAQLAGARADNFGEALSESQTKQIEDLTAKHEALVQEKADTDEKNAQLRSQLALQQKINEELQRAKKRASYMRPSLTAEESAIKRELAKKYRGALNDVTRIVTLVAEKDFRKYAGLVLKEMAGDFVKFSHELIENVGEGIKEHLPKLYEELTGVKSELHGEKKSLKTAIKEGFNLADLEPMLKKRLRELVEDGIKDHKEITETITKEAENFYNKAGRPVDFTERDVRDILSGYGKVKHPNPEEVAKDIREINEKLRLTSSKEDVLIGKAPLRSGYQGDPKSDEVRQMRQEVKRIMKENGIADRTPEQRWKTSLATIKTGLKNRISDLHKIINDYHGTGELAQTPTKERVPLDAEALQLKSVADHLKDKLAEIEKETGVADEKKVKQSLSIINEATKKLQARIENKDFTDKAKTTAPVTPELSAAREAKKELLDKFKELRNQADPYYEERKALETWRTAANTRLAKSQEKLDAIRSGTFEGPVKKTFKFSSEDNRLQGQIKQVQRDIDYAREQIRLANRPKTEKVIDAIVNYRTAINLLSGIYTLGKLGSYSAVEVLAKQPLDMLGIALSKALLPKTAELSRSEGHFGGQMEFYRTLFKGKTYQDAWELKTKSQALIDLLFDNYTKTDKFIISGGKIHAIEKYPLKKATFEKYFIKYGEAMQREIPGFDMTNEANQKIVGGMALAQANRAILQNKNILTNWYRGALASLERQGVKGKVGYYALKTLFPIVNVPVNFTVKTARAYGGILEAATRLAYYGKDMKPDQADAVLRAFKAGLPGLGLGMMALFTNAISIDDDKHLMIGGWKVPTWATHHPDIFVMKLFAEAKAESQSVYKSGENEGQQKGALHGLEAMGIETSQEIPFLNDRVYDAITSPEKLNRFLTNLAVSFVEPQGLKDIAKMKDTPGEIPSKEWWYGDPNKRTPQGFVDELMMGIPGLREEVGAAATKSPAQQLKARRKELSVGGQLEALKKQQRKQLKQLHR